MWNSRRAARGAALLSAMLLSAMLPNIARAQNASPLPAVVAPAATPAAQELLLDVTINGQAVGTTTVLRYQDQLWASEADFGRWRLRLPAGPRLTYRGEAFAPLSGVTSSPPRLDERALTLNLEVPVAAFESSVLTLDPNAANPTPRSFGAYLNYQLGAGYQGGDGAAWTADGAADVGVSTPFGVGRGSFSLALGPDGARFVRDLTTWIVDVRQGPYSVRLGDNLSAGGAWGVPLLYGGVQWATNFALWPELPSAPLLTVEGETPVPGTASVYVNGSLVLTRDVPAGPFRIAGIPATIGSGLVRVVVRDVNGQVREVRRPFLSDATLLRPGLAAFSLDAGWLRQGYGIRSFSYGPFFVSGVYRRGLSEALTAELRGEVSAQAFSAGGSVAWAWPGVGTLRATLAGSASDAGPGALGALGLYGQQDVWAYSGSLTLRTPAFRQLGAGDDAPPLQGALSVGRTLGAAGDLSVSYAIQRQLDGAFASALSGSYTVALGNFDLSFGATQQLAPAPRTTFTLGATAHYGGDTTLSAATSLQGVQLALGRSATLDRPGYSVGAGFSGGQLTGSGQLFWLSSLGAVATTGTLGPDGASFGAQVTGGVALLGGRVQLGQQVQDAYALVQVGFPNVRVYRGGQLVGRTDARGALLVPNLEPYARNVLSIDSRDLPLNTSVGSAEQTVVPSGGSGTIVAFPVRIERAALLRLILSDGQPVPLGATVRVDGGAAEYPVVDAGQTYVQGLSAKSRLHASWEEGQCEAEVTYPQTQDPFADLGVVKCENN